MNAENFHADKNAPPPPHGLFTVVEASLASRLGIPRKLITTIRQEVLTKDADWRLIEKEVRLTEAAVERIVRAYGSLKNAPDNDARAVLGQKMPPPPPSEATPFKVAEIENAKRQSASTPDIAPIIELVVKARCLTNPKILFAYAPNGGDQVVVRVQNSAHWLSQMKVRCRRVGPATYERVGRDPRWRGDRP